MILLNNQDFDMESFNDPTQQPRLSAQVEKHQLYP